MTTQNNKEASRCLNCSHLESEHMETADRICQSCGCRGYRPSLIQTMNKPTSTQNSELRRGIERILKDHEDAVRTDISNHISGDKSRDSFITCADSRMQLENLINQEALALLDRLEKALPDTSFHGSSIKVKEKIRDGGYHDGVRDSRLVIEAEKRKYE